MKVHVTSKEYLLENKFDNSFIVRYTFEKKNVSDKHQQTMNGNYSLFFLLLPIIQLSFACPFNSFTLPSALSCIQNIACEIDDSGNQIAFLQNCNTKWYYGINNTIIQLKSTSINNFLSLSKKATNLKSNFYYSLINYNNINLYCFIFNSKIYDFYLPVNPGFIDYQLLSLSSIAFKTLILYPYNIVTIVFYNNATIQSKQVYNISDELSKISCFQNGICSIGTIKGNLLIFDSIKNKIEFLYESNQNNSIIIIQAKTVNYSTNFSKLYIAYASGKIVEYYFQGNILHKQRTCILFMGTSIYSLKSFSNSNYLIISDTIGNVSQIDLTTGILLDSTNMKSYLSNKSNVSMSILLNNLVSFYLYNSVNSVIFYLEINPSDTKRTVTLYCYSMFYYDSNSQLCSPCNQLCVTCDPLSGACTDCFPGYFNNAGTCYSCYYSSQGLTQYFDQCFSFYDKQIMETSQKVVTFLSVILSNFALFLNVCGLLFLFLKLINNWNIICFYFFVPIQLPFFLENILLTMFKIFNQSVLQNIGINFNLSLNGIEERGNIKFQLVNISTDFLNLNAESIILFIYSVILILTVCKLLNRLLGKINVYLFEQNSAISILDEFVGSFTTSLLPFYLIFFNNSLGTFVSKINSILHIMLIGVSLFVTILFLNLNYQFKIIKTNKIHNQDQDTIARFIKQGLIKITKTWKQNQSMQKFLYALLSFNVAIFAPPPNPYPFMIIVGMIHFLSLINALKRKKRSISQIFQKIWFLSFHGCFNSLYYIQDQYLSFQISLASVMLIIIIALHQIIATICSKVYFIYKIFQIRSARSAQISYFFQKENNSKQKNKRMHPISIDKIPGLSKDQNLKTIKYKFKSYDITCSIKTEKNIPNSKNQKKEKKPLEKKKDDSLSNQKQVKKKIIFGLRKTIQEQTDTNNYLKRGNNKYQ